MVVELLLYIVAGAVVGFAVGLTGVGGGSLMTPLLLLFGYPAPVAIGTDLLYAAVTKASGGWFHHVKGHVHWRVVGWLAAGSIPVSLALNFFVMDADFRANENYEALLTSALGVMLLVTAVVMGFQPRIQQRMKGNTQLPTADHHGPPYPFTGFTNRHAGFMTVAVGMLLGLCVTLSSVGAGAFGAAVLFLLYPRMRAVDIVGTDIAHAVPLTLVAGLGYLYHGLVDFLLLLALVCGSLPGIWLGTHMGSKLPERLMRTVLVLILFGLGLNFSVGGAH